MVYFQLYQLAVQILYVLSVACIKESYSIEGKYTKNVSNYKIVYPVKVSSPNQPSRRYRRWQEAEGTTVHYKLNLGGNDEWIDLEPNYHILSPGAVLEHRTSSAIDNEPLANVQLEQPSFTQCFFRGKVRNYDDSSTALSTCGGLCGYIRVKRHTYFIEPVERQNSEPKQDQPHVLYEDEQTDINAFNCATKFTADENYKPLLAKNISKLMHPENSSTSNPVPNKRLHIETLLVMDQSMMDLHDANDLQNYALTVFNMAQSLFHDLSTDPPIDLEIVRIIEVEDPKEIINVRHNSNMGNVEMDTFSTWQLRINPKDENHPNHHDLAILLTGSDICDDEKSCHYVGLAETKGACRPKRQAAICKDTGLMLGYIIAHQIAHTLGVGHDPPVKSPDGTSSVMSPTITLSPKVWSEESRGALMSAIRERQLTCLEDEPATERFKVTDILPGVMYDADYQCQQLLTPGAKSCTKNGDCQSLACELDGTSCSNTGVMPAPGTSCGLNKWCFDGACLEAGNRPEAVQGNWGAWSEWSQCSRTCGTGVSVCKRECDSPAPMHGGKSCPGPRSRHKICTTEPCQVDSVPFRDVQCAEYDDWVFPEDGQVHHWKGFFVSNANPCALYCRNDKDIVVSLSPKVKDGTTCYRGLRDICVDGICRDIPCDLQFGSDSVEDACGICHGDGTGCKVLQGQKNVQQGTSPILSIPAGTRNIVVEEAHFTPSHLILKTPETDNPFNERWKLGTFNASGSMGWLGMKKPNQEILEIPGPLIKPVEIWISSDGPQLVTYTMGLPSEPREGNYSWDYIDWSSCKAQCGDSYQESIPKCVEIFSGHVEDKYCSPIVKPPIKTRSCNAGICLPRWLVGEWQECGPCPSKHAKRFRIVRCIKPISGSEEGMAIISDAECPGLRPVGSEPCRCIKRQVLYWPSPYRFDMLANDFKILPKRIRENKTSKMQEKKVTLMQLENENEESMLKQFKENQQKHHSIFYMPHVLGSSFNFSIPFKKREANINELPGQDPVPFLDDKYTKYLPKPDVLDIIKTGNKMMENNKVKTPHSMNIFHLKGQLDKLNSKNIGRLRPLSTNDPPPLHFSDQNILKLLSDNLPLDRLKQHRYLDHNNKNQFGNFLDIPNIFVNDSGFILPKQEKRMDIINILMNEFNNVLETDALIQTNIKNHSTSNIPPIQNINDKSRDFNFENRIYGKKQPFYFAFSSSLDTPSPFENSKNTYEIINDSNSSLSPKESHFGLNNQIVTESWSPSTDVDWSKLLSEFKQNFFEMQIKPQLKSNSKAINEQLDKNIFFISTRPTINNVNSVRHLTRKVTEKLNSLCDADKFKAYQVFTALVKNLRDTLSTFPSEVNPMDQVQTSREALLEPIGDDGFEIDINKENGNDFLIPIDQDELTLNNNQNIALNYNSTMFDRPIFSAEDLAKIKHIFQSGVSTAEYVHDNEEPAEYLHYNEAPEFFQLKLKNKPDTPKTTKKKIETTTTATSAIPKSTTVSIFNNHLNEFIENFQKSDSNRNKKEAVKKLKPLNNKVRIGRFIKECTIKVTTSRRITGIYDIPQERICPPTTSTRRPRFFLHRCRKNIGRLSLGNKNEILDGNPLLEGTFFLPKRIKLIKVMGRKKRYKSFCEESTRICVELQRRFKERLANVKKLDPYQCQRLREDIIKVKHNLMSEQNLQKDLEKISSNKSQTCLFRYADDRDTTTPFPFD